MGMGAPQAEASGRSAAAGGNLELQMELQNLFGAAKSMPVTLGANAIRCAQLRAGFLRVLFGSVWVKGCYGGVLFRSVWEGGLFGSVWEGVARACVPRWAPTQNGVSVCLCARGGDGVVCELSASPRDVCVEPDGWSP
eukprot:366296-Chlamydomonas_euryale.AAC.22